MKTHWYAFAGVAVLFVFWAGTPFNESAAMAAPVPCWQKLIKDWSDGHIDGRYPASCYRNAMANAPTDLRIYSTLETDLQTAPPTRIVTASRRRTLALAGAQQIASSSPATHARLIALFAVLGGVTAAASLGIVLARCRRERPKPRH